MAAVGGDRMGPVPSTSRFAGGRTSGRQSRCRMFPDRPGRGQQRWQRASWWYGGSQVRKGTCRAGIGTPPELKTAAYRVGMAPISQYLF